MMKKLAIAMLAMMLMVGANLSAEEAAKCGCGEACDKASCACATCPAAVKEAAMKAVEGLKVGCVHAKKTDAGTVYTVNGKVGDKATSVTVTVDAEGKVTATKHEEAKAGHEGHNH